MKRCSKCKTEKPLTDFYRHSTMRDGRHSYCKRCFIQANKSWVKRNPEKARGYLLKRKYGLSVEVVREILSVQQHRCAICTRPLNLLKTGHVDHDHKTGVVRGILCGSCNRAIGLLQDDPFIISEAAAYLENSGEVGNG